MSQNYRDPFTYLNEAVSKRGKSGHEGVYLANVTVVAEAEEDYGYKNPDMGPGFRSHESLVSQREFDSQQWLELLVSLRSQTQEKSHCIQRGDRTFQFLPEGGNLSLNVFLPEVFCASFDFDVAYCQSLLRIVARFCGKIPTTIRFNIGLAHRFWSDLVENDEVQEMDLNY